MGQVERNIFKYNDGESDVFGDPTEIDFQLDRLGVEEILKTDRIMMIPFREDGTLDVDKATKEDIRLLLDSYHECEPLIREAFRVRPFDRTTGIGLLYEQVIELYALYCDWKESLKKNIVSAPTSATPTA